jgi:hypothetical protein
MSTGLLGAFAWIVGFGAFVIAAVWLVRRSERRLDPRQGDSRPPIAPGPDGAPISTYLDRVTSAMALPAADVADVRAELIDHLEDSISTLESEGFGHEDAVREALGRLGPPAELGRQLGAAHQSTRRLLAGAGGGVFTAAGGFVLGYMGGIALAYLLLIAGALCIGLLTLVGIATPNLMYDQNATVNSLMEATTLLVAAFVATRYAVRTSAGLSRRSPRSVAVFWAIAAALVFGWLAIFGWHGQQSWPGVIAFLLVPLVAVAAAWVRIERPMPHVVRWSSILGLGGVFVVGLSLILLLGMTVSSSGPTNGSLSPLIATGPPDYHFDIVAPPAPDAWNPQGSISGGGMRSDTSGGELYSAITDQNAAVPMTTVLSYWHDLRFEAWHSLPDDPSTGFGLDTKYSEPFAVLPAEIHPTWLQAVFHLERLRDAGFFQVVLTGVGPDGKRYMLDDCGGGESSFNGSVWDWLTAPQ